MSQSWACVYVRQRGRHPPANKTSDADIDLIKEHIKSFSQYSHSRANNPHRKYLSPELTISKMYVLFNKEWCVGKEKTPQSEWVYRQVFNKSFNLLFGS